MNQNTYLTLSQPWPEAGFADGDLRPDDSRLYLLIAPHPAVDRLMDALAVRLALAADTRAASSPCEAGPSEPYLHILDGGNRFDLHGIARGIARGSGSSVRVEAILQHIRVARAFTCYQTEALLAGVADAHGGRPHGMLPGRGGSAWVEAGAGLAALDPIAQISAARASCTRSAVNQALSASAGIRVGTSTIRKALERMLCLIARDPARGRARGMRRGGLRAYRRLSEPVKFAPPVARPATTNDGHRVHIQQRVLRVVVMTDLPPVGDCGVCCAVWSDGAPVGSAGDGFADSRPLREAQWAIVAVPAEIET